MNRTLAKVLCVAIALALVLGLVSVQFADIASVDVESSAVESADVNIYELLDYMENDLSERIAEQRSAGDSGYYITRKNTQIIIDGNTITVKTTVQSALQDKVYRSADYVFTTYEENGNILYRLESADIYKDDRNAKTDVLLTLDGVDFSVPWLTVYRNGIEEYHALEPYYEYIWEHFRGTDEIRLAGIKNGKAYVGVVYGNIVDTYIYDFNSKSGYWMSGAKDLETFYKTELDFFKNASYDNYSGLYRNYHIVTISQKHDYALLRRNRTLGEADGEYVLHNLKTGKETFICNSYTWPGSIMSSDSELIIWVNEDHLQLMVYIDGSTDKHYNWAGSDKNNCTAPTFYSAIYNGRKWVVKEIDEDEIVLW